MPAELERYPADWDEVRARIRARSGGRCECRGECGEHAERCEEQEKESAKRFKGPVHLAAAHLNHTPEDCRDENLRDFCQRCHFMFDRHEHGRHKRETHEARRFEEGFEVSRAKRLEAMGSVEHGVQAAVVPDMPRPEVVAPRQELVRKGVEPERVRQLLGDGTGPVPGGYESPLRVYLKLNSVSEQSFARALGVVLRTVQLLAKGETLPTLPVAYEIERITKGVVPIEAWLGVDRGLKMLGELREKQPEGVRAQLKPPCPVGTTNEERVAEAKLSPASMDELERAEKS